MIVDKAITALLDQGMNLHQYKSKKHSKLRLSEVKIFGIHTVNHQRRAHLVLWFGWHQHNPRERPIPILSKILNEINERVKKTIIYKPFSQQTKRSTSCATRRKSVNL